MKRLLLLGTLLWLLVACGSSGSSGPSEKNLKSQMLSTWSAFQSGDYAKLYSYVSDDVRSHCTLDQFKAQTQLVRGSVGDNFLKSRLFIDNVQIQGTRASYESTYSLNGAILSVTSRYVHWERDHWVPDQDPTSAPNPNFPCNPF